MKRISRIVLTSFLVLSLWVPLCARAADLPLLSSGYTEDGTYYEVYGEQSVQRGAVNYVTRQVVYSGDVIPPMKIEWKETISGKLCSGTLQLRRSTYDKKENKTLAVYEGYLYLE